MYSEKVMDHFNNPRNVGEIENPSGVGTVGNAKCGDIMRMMTTVLFRKPNSRHSAAVQQLQPAVWQPNW